MKNLQKGDKKLLNAWAFYDWANSVYTLVITSAIFPIFYNGLFTASNPYVSFCGYSFKNSALISFITALGFLIVAFISPLLSGIADYVGNKKTFLRFFCYLGAFSCIGLYWFSIENIYLGLLFYILGLIGFWGSLVFYNSYLPDIAHPEQQDAISAKGYSLGYFGSVILLILCLFLVLSAKDAAAREHAMRLSFVLTGLWWIIFSQYSYIYLPSGNKEENKKITTHILFNGFNELKKVWHQLGETIVLKGYLTSFFVYSMAVQTIMIAATYFGSQEIEWSSESESTIGLIICILVIQLVAILGAYLTSKASEKYGNIPTLIGINTFWLVLCGLIFFIHKPIEFYVMAGLVGLVMGGIQSLSRSTYSKLLPETQDTASFFSFYDVAEKIGIVIGMLLYGLIDQATGSPRMAIVFLGTFFLIGIVLLFRIPKTK